LPHAPNIMAPRHSWLTLIPVDPRLRVFIEALLLVAPLLGAP
jgi:hypothetical protein